MVNWMVGGMSVNWGSIQRLGEMLSEMLNKSFDERECLDYILNDRVEYRLDEILISGWLIE